MAIEFNDDQNNVINSRGKDVLVSAAAGSGKTAVLVERIVRLVSEGDNPIDIDRLLVVTFTNAAAAEMRERVSAALEERILKDPNNEHLQKQAVLVHNAHICTIDSFCGYVLRNNFNEVDVEPGYRTPDSGEIALLQKDVLKELFEERYSEQDEEKRKAFIDLVEFYAPNGNDEILEEIISGLYKTSQSMAFPEEWLEKQKNIAIPRTVEEFEQTDYVQEFINNQLKIELKTIHDLYKKAVEIAQMPDGPYFYGQVLEDELEMVEKVLEATSFEEIGDRLRKISFNKLPGGKKSDAFNEDLKDIAKGIRDKCKKMIGKLISNEFSYPLEVQMKREIECMKVIRTLIEVTVDFTGKYEALKRDKKLMEFSDVAHAATRILVSKDDKGNLGPTAAALELGKKFDEILIDEYQDTNGIQEALLNAVCCDRQRGQHMFMVGDVKQSIYKFRKAKPELFINKYKNYALNPEGKERIDLKMNFRSRYEVLRITNVIFSHIMDESYGGVDYDDKAALYYGAKYPEVPEINKPELMLIQELSDDEDGRIEQEVKVIAGRIKELIKTQKITYKDKDPDTKEEVNKLRNCRFSDIVILLSSYKGWENAFRKIFNANGIPVYIQNSTGYFDTTEVSNVLNFLRTIDNPTRNVPMFASLKSHFGGFTDEEIARIRVISGDKKNVNLYDNLNMAINNDCIDSNLQEKIQKFIQKLQLYRGMATYEPVRKLLYRIFEDSYYLEYVSALPAGSVRKANVEMLLVKAGDFEKTSYHGLFHFIRYIEQLQKYNTEEGEADIQEENADVVRIMTIHKSKGLEFPVTILCGLHKNFNDQDSNDGFVVDDSLGIASKYMDISSRCRYETIHRKVISTKIKVDTRAERLRLLYVAMTRAKEKLIMTGVIGKEDKIEKCFSKYLTARTENTWRLSRGELDCNSLLDYILKALIRHPSIEKLFEITNVQLKPVKEIPCEYDFCKDENVDDIDISLVDSSRIDDMNLLDEAVREYTSGELMDINFRDIRSRKYYEEVLTRFNFVYTHSNLSNLYTKTSVSELKMAALAEEGEPVKELFNEPELKPYVPSFRREKEEISGTTRGSAFHRVLELLDFTKLTSDSLNHSQRIAEINKDMDSFVLDERLTKEYRDAVVTDKIATFLESNLAKRMARADEKGLLYREQPFVYGISAARINKEFPTDEKILIQGIIDAFFIEDGKIVLMDYKTDVIDRGQELIDRYRTQLDYYKEALEAARGLAVSEMILYSFNLLDEIKVDL